MKTVPMDELAMVQTVMVRTGCPACGEQCFELRVEGDLEAEHHRFVATCGACGESFVVTWTLRPSGIGRPCPWCSGGAPAQAAHCDHDTHECHVAWHFGDCEMGSSLLVGS